MNECSECNSIKHCFNKGDYFICESCVFHKMGYVDDNTASEIEGHIRVSFRKFISEKNITNVKLKFVVYGYFKETPLINCIYACIEKNGEEFFGLFSGKSYEKTKNVFISEVLTLVNKRL